ncbi:DUF2599 domain-containing protein [Nocardia transvalensis]|nr:DUF2599 domain-containing protein [Nocardia transvalensis]
MVSGCALTDDSAPVALSSGPATHTATTTTPPAPPIAPAPPAGTVATPTVDQFADSPLIEHTEWTDDPDGRRLRVFPTAAGRLDTFPTAVDRAWGEVVTSAPDADTPGMYDQFKCHWDWARPVKPDKPSWNLEPWRPAVGYEATVQALCNPGGPDPAGN